MQTNFRLTHPHIKADIFYLNSAVSGRSTPIHSGYRGQFFYKSTNWDIAQEFIGKDICYPGEKIQSLIQFATAHNILKITIGSNFEIREGDKVIGEGIVTEIIDSDMSKPTTQKKLYSDIDEILWNEWDPIGVNEHPEARDEYQSYVPRVFSLKLKGGTAQQIADCLIKIEREEMGLFGKPDHNQIIAQKILELK